MKRRNLLIAACAAAVALISAAELAEAKPKVIHFKGTRAQVRAACTGGVLVEGFDSKGIGTTWCGKDDGSGVVCGDDGNCQGSPAGRTFGAGTIRVRPGGLWQGAGTYQAQPGLASGPIGTFQAQ